MYLIVGCSTANEICECLKKIYSQATKVINFSKGLGLKYKTFSAVMLGKTPYSTLNQFINALTSSKISEDEEEVSQNIITWYSLPKKGGEYERTTLTLEKHVSCLQDREQVLITVNIDHVFSTTKHFKVKIRKRIILAHVESVVGIIILLLSFFIGGINRINLLINYDKQRLDITFISKH